MMSLRVVTCLAVVLLGAQLGCGDDGGVTDGAADGAGDGGIALTPPDIPWLGGGVPPIMLAPCAAGWREVTGGEVSECDPYPEGGPQTCALGEAHFPGEPGCRPIGDPCPTGDYATTLPSDGALVYVKAGASPGGDGSIDAPYAALSEVSWPSLAIGTTVALARGTYQGTLPLKAGVRVIGACVSETILTGVAAPVLAVVSVTSAGEPAGLRNVAIVDPPQRGAQIDSGRGLALEGVLIEGALGAGMAVADEGTVVMLSDAVVRDTRPNAGRFGQGINVQDGARLEATRLLVTDNRDAGIYAGEAGTEVILTDAVIRDTQEQESDRRSGRGIQVQDGARLEATRVLLAGNREVGLLVQGGGTDVLLTEAVIRDTRPRASDDTVGRGIHVGDGARLESSRLLVAGNREVGFFIRGALTEVSVTDAVVRDTESQTSDLLVGWGVQVAGGARFQATRLLVAGNRDIGLLVAQEGTEAVLDDAVVRDTRPRELDDAFGRGIGVQDGARFEAARLLVEGNRDSGLFIGGEGTVVTLEDVVVRDVRPEAFDGSGGRGVQVQVGARLDGQRLEIDGVREAGIVAVVGALVSLRDVSITRVELAACAPSTCAERSYGYAAAALSATLRLSRFRLSEAATCGVFLSPASPSSTEPTSVDLELGVVSESAIGACVQVDGYDFDRLTNRVEYRGNGVSLDSTRLPVPDFDDSTGP